MVKGVNKKIVEIKDTGNIYFEKAILYVRPQMTDTPQKHLLKEAKFYLRKTYPSERRNSLYSIKKFLIIAAILTVITAVIIFTILLWKLTLIIIHFFIDKALFFMWQNDIIKVIMEC